MKEVVRVSPPPEPVTIMVYVPFAMEEEAEIVQLLVNVGLPDKGAKDAVAPEGSPDADKVTVWVAPDVRVIATLLESEPPWVTEIPRLLLKAKLKPVGSEILT